MNSINEAHNQSLLVAIFLLLMAPCFTANAAKLVSDWPVASADFDQEKIASLDQAIEDDVYKRINSVIVIRDGALLVERYYNGADRDSTHNPRSVGKTFTAAILGLDI